LSDPRTRDPEQPRASTLSRLRAWLGRADSPLPRPAAPRLRPIRRAWPLAVWQARAAVVARVPLADFLRARLASYDARLPVPRSRLPVRVELAAGEIRASVAEDPSPDAPAAPDPDLPDRSALEALEGPGVHHRFTEAQARLASLSAAEDAARARFETLALRFSSDVAAGAVVAAPDPTVLARELGRPTARSPAGAAALAGLAGAAMLAEAWALALPMLRSAASYPPHLAPGPGLLAIGLVGAFALAVAMGLLALALAAVDALAELGRSAPRAVRRRWTAGLALAGLLTAGAVAAAAGAPVLRTGVAPAREALLLLALPAGAALALRAAGRARRRREVELVAVLAWDRARTVALAERGRRLEELDFAEAALRRAAGRAARARQRVQRLQARAEAAARLLARAAGRERRRRYRLASSLLGALEQDRYEYLRQAAARGLDDLAPGAPGGPQTARPAEGTPGPTGGGRVTV
jgi:hypothetical protein